MTRNLYELELLDTNTTCGLGVKVLYVTHNSMRYFQNMYK